MSRASVQTVYVLNRIREDILYRRLTNEEPLTENNLASILGVSRTPIREAIGVLQLEGVLKRENGRIMINFLDHSQSIELELIRIGLEGLAAEFAAKRIDEHGRQKLLSNLEESEKYKGGNLFELSRLNDQFHRTIAIVSGLPYLVEILENIQTKLKLSQSVKFISEKRRENSVREHEELANIIISGEAKKARKSAERHVMATYELMLRSVPSEEKGAWQGSVIG